MKNIDVVVIGQNYSTSLGLIQAAGEAGYSVGVIHNAPFIPRHHSPEQLSKYVVKSSAISRNDPDFISKLIDNYSNESRKTVLLPADDYSVELIDRHLSILEDFFYVSNIRHEQGRLFFVMDKGYQSQLSERVGMPTAKNWTLTLDGTSNFSVPSDITYPCITKPKYSIGSPKTNICYCESREDLVKKLNEIGCTNPSEILIEKYIDIETEFTVPCLALKKEVYIPVFLQKTRIGSGSHKGVTITGKVVDAKFFSAMVEKLKNFIALTEIEGILDIELFKSGDSFYFNELNLRYGAAGYALTRSGINMAELWIKYCKGEIDKIDNLVFKDGLTFVSDKAAFDNYMAGYLSWGQYRRLLSSVDFRFIIDNPDTSAAKAFRCVMFKMIVLRKIQQLKSIFQNQKI